MKNKTKLLFLDSFLCLIISSLIITILSVIITQLSIFDPFSNAFKDFSFLDIYYSEKMGGNKKINPEIILVNIEHKDRYELAKLLSKIQDQKPKVIGVDVIFKDRQEEYSDSLLTRELKRENVINSFAYYDNSIIKNHPKIVESHKSAGFSNISFDKENKVIRNFKGILETPNSAEYSFISQIIKKYDPILWKDIKSKLKATRPIKYYGNYKHYLQYDYDEIMKMDSLPSIKNSIVLFGYLGSPTGNKFDIEDKHFTPLNNKVAGKSAPDTFGITIHANILEMILARDFITPVGKITKILIGLILTYFSLAYFIWLNKKAVVRYMFTKKLVQFILSICLLYFSLYLLKINILFKPAPIIAYIIISVECIGVYKIFINYFHKKYQWRSYYFV